MKTKRIAIAGMSAALAFGAGSGFLMSLPSSASAASTQVAAVTTPTDPSAPVTPSADAAADSNRPGPGEHLTSALQPLVDAGTITAEQSSAIVTAVQAADDAADAAGTKHDPKSLLTDTLSAQVSSGTITQAQSDAITAAAEAARPVGGPGGGRGGDHGGGRHGRGANLDVAATAFGMTAADLKTELDAGKTIAAVATEKGVDVQKVIDALVADATSDITQHITDMVNGVQPTPPADAPTTTANG